MCVVHTGRCELVCGFQAVSQSLELSVSQLMLVRVRECKSETVDYCVFVTLSEEKAAGKLKTTKTDRETRGDGRTDRTSDADRSFSFPLTNGLMLFFHLSAKTFSSSSHFLITHTHLHTNTNCSSFYNAAEPEINERISLNPEAAKM